MKAQLGRGPAGHGAADPRRRRAGEVRAAARSAGSTCLLCSSRIRTWTAGYIARRLRSARHRDGRSLREGAPAETRIVPAAETLDSGDRDSDSGDRDSGSVGWSRSPDPPLISESQPALRLSESLISDPIAPIVLKINSDIVIDLIRSWFWTRIIY